MTDLDIQHVGSSLRTVLKESQNTTSAEYKSDKFGCRLCYFVRFQDVGLLRTDTSRNVKFDII